jgi:hypothetical protein
MAVSTQNEHFRASSSLDTIQLKKCQVRADSTDIPLAFSTAHAVKGTKWNCVGYCHAALYVARP